MLTSHLAAIVTAALSAGPSTTPDASMLRYPDIGKSDIVFVFQGNLWLVPKSGGMARPLTSAAGAESMPRFSPDGTEIALDNGGAWANRAVWQAHYTATSVPLLTTMHGWQPEGDWTLIVQGGNAAQATLTDFAVITHGWFTRATP
jgi:tricorn protease